MSAKVGKKEVTCLTFQPQAWRPTRCKNCFKTREQHGDEDETLRPQDPKGAKDGKPESTAAAKSTAATDKNVTPKNENKQEFLASEKPSSKTDSSLSKMSSQPAGKKVAEVTSAQPQNPGKFVAGTKQDADRNISSGPGADTNSESNQLGKTDSKITHPKAQDENSSSSKLKVGVEARGKEKEPAGKSQGGGKVSGLLSKFSGAGSSDNTPGKLKLSLGSPRPPGKLRIKTDKPSTPSEENSPITSGTPTNDETKKPLSGGKATVTPTEEKSDKSAVKTGAKVPKTEASKPEAVDLREPESEEKKVEDTKLDTERKKKSPAAPEKHKEDQQKEEKTKTKKKSEKTKERVDLKSEVKSKDIKDTSKDSKTSSVSVPEGKGKKKDEVKVEALSKIKVDSVEEKEDDCKREKAGAPFLTPLSSSKEKDKKSPDSAPEKKSVAKKDKLSKEKISPGDKKADSANTLSSPSENSFESDRKSEKEKSPKQESKSASAKKKQKAKEEGDLPAKSIDIASKSHKSHAPAKKEKTSPKSSSSSGSDIDESDFKPSDTFARIKAELTSEDEDDWEREREKARKKRKALALKEEEEKDKTRLKKMEELSEDLSREEAMMHGTRLLMDNLRDKVLLLEEKCDKIDREKNSLGDLLNVKKKELYQLEEDSLIKINKLEEKLRQLESENARLVERMKLPESDRVSMRGHESVIAELESKLQESENKVMDILEENSILRQEIKDLQLEMDEMHDQFREDEALEFRELQKELEATAKNCRILQFKLRKQERRNDQVEADRMQYEEKVRQLEGRFSNAEDKQHIRELEEELKMAKEVSVRLHDELEAVEERRAKYEEEIDKLNDYFRDSENKRLVLESDVKRLTMEIEKAQGEEGKKLAVPEKKHGLVKQGSVEYDIAQLLRDIADGQERENDLKEQLQHAEEENKTLRKNLRDMEDEAESLTMQLEKMSSASKFLKKKGSDRSDEKEVITEREHAYRLQLEIAEQEIKVLKRKLDEMEQENENLMGEVNFLQQKYSGKETKSIGTLNEYRYEQKVNAMAQDIEDLKWKLLEKDAELEKLQTEFFLTGQHREKGRLQKSRSLDQDEHDVELQRQLDSVNKEAGVLRDRLKQIESENDRLIEENKKLQMLGKRKIPAIQTDDSALKNIELQDTIKKLEEENCGLREKIRLLDQRTHKLSREVTRAVGKGTPPEDTSESRDLRDQLGLTEETCVQLKRKMAELEDHNTKLTLTLNKFEAAEEEKNKRKKPKEDDGSAHKLENRIKDLESEITDLRIMVKNREAENGRLEEEIDAYRDDMDKMLDAFRNRESELMEEIESVQQKNDVLTNLLDLVTERAESTQRELEKFVEGSARSERSGSVVSAISDVSTGSDDVFLQAARSEDGAKSVVHKDWEAQFKKRIECLEHLLAEERQKVHAAEKRLQMRDSPKSGQLEDFKFYEREKHILQQELSLCQRQLKEATEQINQLKEKLELVKQDYEDCETDLDKVTKELQEERRKKSSDQSAAPGAPKGITGGGGKEPASWRWEKQELERQIKEYKKKTDDLHQKLQKQGTSRRGSAESSSGDDKDNKSKDEAEKSLKQMKDERDNLKKQLGDLQKHLEKLEDDWKKKEKSFKTEKDSCDKEIILKDDIIKQKDDIIRQKDDLIKEKDNALKDKEKDNKAKLSDLIQKNDMIKQKEQSLKRKDNEIYRINDQLKLREATVKEKDEVVRNLNETVRIRDNRLKEKDEIIARINKTIKEKELDLSDKDNNLRQNAKKVKEKEDELKAVQKTNSEKEKELQKLNDRLREMTEKFNKLEKEQKKMASNVSDREKLGNQVEALRKEKDHLEKELERSADTTKKKEQTWQKDVDKLELELKQAKEKLHSLELTSKFRQGDAVKALTKEKETLINEKHKLLDEIEKLKREIENSRKSWNMEREDLRKIIEEKTKLVEDSDTICERMQKEMDKLKCEKKEKPPQAKPADTQASAAPAREEDKHKQLEELMARLERQDTILKVEKENLQQQFDVRVKGIQCQLSQAQNEIQILKKESFKQKELIQSSQRTLADVKNKYDIETTSWNEEKLSLERRAKEVDDSRKLIVELQKRLEELVTKHREEEKQRLEFQNKLATEKSAWNLERSELLEKLQKLEEQPSSTSKVGKVQSKFKQQDQQQKRDAAMEKELAKHKKMARESHNLAIDLQDQLNRIEVARERERKELTQKLDKVRNEWQKEREDLKDRNNSLEERARQLSTIQKSLIDLQVKMQTEKEEWNCERSQLQNQLEESRKLQIRDQTALDELLVEVKKLKDLTPMLENQLSKTEELRLKRQASVEKKKVTTTIALTALGGEKGESSSAHEALEALNRLSSSSERPRLRESDKSKTPASLIFRRSLSTSEVELYDHYDDSPDISIPVASIPSGPSLEAPPDLDERPRRARPLLRRSLSTQQPGSEGHAPGQPPFYSTLTRTSAYASGTQSAYSSRDASPDKRWRSVRKISNYPTPPPSFLISPRASPARQLGPARTGSSDTLSSKNMTKLYEKLSAMEQNGTEPDEISEKQPDTYSTLPARLGKSKKLVKSASIDTPYSVPPEPILQPKSSLALAAAFDDAPKSHTVPGSIYAGGQVIVPGHDFGAKDTKHSKEKQLSSQEEAKKAARQRFYDDYHQTHSAETSPTKKEISGFMSLPTRRKGSMGAVAAFVAKFNQAPEGPPTEETKKSSKEIKDGKITHTKTAYAAVKPNGEQGGRLPSSVTHETTGKDKRKLFGAKKSLSVDSSAVESSIARIGVECAKPAAPSTFEPYVSPVSLNLTKPGHRRAQSADKATFLSAGSRSVTSPVSPDSSSSASSMVGRDTSDSSISSRLSRYTSGTSVFSGDTVSPGGKDRGQSEGTCLESSFHEKSRCSQSATPPSGEESKRWRSKSLEEACSSVPVVFAEDKITPYRVWDFTETSV